MPRLAVPALTALLAAWPAPALCEPLYHPVVLNPGGHPYGVSAASVTPDGKTVLTAGNEGALRGWDANTGRPAFVLWLPPKTSPSLAGPLQLWVSPDSKVIALRYLADETPRNRVCLVPLDRRG